MCASAKSSGDGVGGSYGGAYGVKCAYFSSVKVADESSMSKAAASCATEGVSAYSDVYISGCEPSCCIDASG